MRIATALAAVLALVLAGCGGDDGPDGPPEAAPFPPTDTGAVAGNAFEEGDEVTIDLAELDGSGTSGTATLVARGTGQTRVVVDVRSDAGAGAGEGIAQIRAGRCDDLGDVAQPVGEVVDGTAERLVDLDLEALLAGEFAVTISAADAGGDPADDPGPALACGSVEPSG